MLILFVLCSRRLIFLYEETFIDASVPIRILDDFIGGGQF